MTAIVRRVAAFALLVAGGIAVPRSVEAQKALVYCPSADATGCAAIGNALSAHGSFPGGADRAFDGSDGTVDLASVDLSGYAVFVVPSLATDGGTDPYAVLRSDAVTSRLRAAFTGRVAVWSGTPDLGTSSLDKKQALIRNLTRWAAADPTAGRAGGIVALQDASPEVIARYGWLAQISSARIASDAAVTEVYANVETRTAAGRAMLDWNGLQLGYTNMASSALIAPAGASVEATGGRTTAAVLVTFAGAAGGAPVATVTTDKEDYAPGELVTITGTGWMPGETVSMRLHEDPVVHGDRTLSAVADSTGSIVNTSFRPEEHDFGVRFVLDAVGQTSGRTAQATFTDGNRSTFSLTANGPAISSLASAAPNECVAVHAQARTGSNIDAGQTGTMALSSAPAGATFFNGLTCAGAPVTSLIFVAANNGTKPLSFRIASAGSFTINGVGSWDAGGGSNNASATITIAAAAPTAEAGGPYSGNEGASVSLGGASASGGAAPLTYSWAYAAGVGVDAGTVCSFSPSASSLNPNVTCTDDGTFTLTLTVTGSNGQSASDNATLTLANVAPTANAGGPYSGAEGSPISLSGTGDDAGNNDDAGLTYLWSVTATGIDAGGTCTIASPTSPNTTVTCTDNGSFSVSLTASDGDGGTSSASTANLTVANAPPVSNAGPGYSGAEGAPVQLNGSGTDAGSNDVLTYLWTANAAGLGGGTCSFDDPTKKDAKVTCTDNGSATLTLTVTDDDGGSHADVATLTLSNVAPVANAGPDYTGNEGSAVQLNGSATDAGTNDTRTWSWQYVSGPSVDAGATCSFSSATAEDPTVTCTDDGVVELTLTVTDDDGGSTSDKANLTLSNVPPTADAGGPYAGNEGSGVALNGSATDAGANDVISYLWTANVSGLDAGASCSFSNATQANSTVTCTDNGTVTLTLKATDDDGGFTTSNATLTVANVVPVADAGTSYTGVEGSAIALNGTVTDAGVNDTHTWSWQYVAGPGALDAGASCTFDDPAKQDPKITCTDDGVVQLTLTVTDDDGGQGTDTATLTVTNAPPVAVAGGPYSGTEGSPVTLAGSATDPGTNDQLAYLWSVATPGIDAGGSCAFDDPTKKDAKVSCTDDGTFTLTLKATDDDGGEDTETATLTIANANPVANAGGPYSGVEGATVALTGTESDAGSNDALSRLWTYSGVGGTCTITNPTALNASIACTDNGTYQVTLTVTDDDLASHASNASFTVSNAAPILSAITAPLAPVNINTAVTVTANFTDVGAADTHTGLISWGDGTATAAAITEANGSGTASGTHAYASPGVYTIRMTVTDDDGAVSNESVYQYIVVFDPSAGFVTGGGWLNSTPGMYRVDAAAQGKANFGFVSKYQKGATVPTGNTEFQFHTGDLNFKSSVYQWLVVQGQTKASYKGSGTINGSGDYGFLLSVIDGGSGGDKFRIKIWNKSANDVVVYDNLLADAGDDALPTTGIMGGNIVVHAK